MLFKLLFNLENCLFLSFLLEKGEWEKEKKKRKTNHLPFTEQALIAAITPNTCLIEYVELTVAQYIH